FRYLALFLFTDPATSDIYTLSLHDALPISHSLSPGGTYATIGGDLSRLFQFVIFGWCIRQTTGKTVRLVMLKQNQDLPYLNERLDRKSTRLNSSHRTISYAVFCLKKKKNT